MCVRVLTVFRSSCSATLILDPSSELRPAAPRAHPPPVRARVPGPCACPRSVRVSRRCARSSVRVSPGPCARRRERLLRCLRFFCLSSSSPPPPVLLRPRPLPSGHAPSSSGHAPSSSRFPSQTNTLLTSPPTSAPLIHPSVCFRSGLF